MPNRLLLSFHLGPVLPPDSIFIRKTIECIQIALDPQAQKSDHRKNILRGEKIIRDLKLAVNKGLGFDIYENINIGESIFFFTGDGEDVRIKNLLSILQYILQHTQTWKYLDIEWAEYPYPGSVGFIGGGAALITPERIKVFGTHQWLKSEIRQLDPEANAAYKKDKKRRHKRRKK